MEDRDETKAAGRYLHHVPFDRSSHGKVGIEGNKKICAPGAEEIAQDYTLAIIFRQERKLT